MKHVVTPYIAQYLGGLLLRNILAEKHWQMAAVYSTSTRIKLAEWSRMAKSFCCQSVVLYAMSYQCPLYITMLQQEDQFQGGVVQAVVHWLLPGCGAQWVTSLKVMMILMTGGRY